MEGKQYRRMPRAAWLKRIQKLQLEVWDWRCHYAEAMLMTNSPVLVDKLQERIWDLDYLWHQLEKPMDVLVRSWR